MSVIRGGLIVFVLCLTVERRVEAAVAALEQILREFPTNAHINSLPRIVAAGQSLVRKPRDVVAQAQPDVFHHESAHFESDRILLGVAGIATQRVCLYADVPGFGDVVEQSAAGEPCGVAIAAAAVGQRKAVDLVLDREARTDPPGPAWMPV